MNFGDLVAAPQVPCLSGLLRSEPAVEVVGRLEEGVGPDVEHGDARLSRRVEGPEGELLAQTSAPVFGIEEDPLQLRATLLLAPKRHRTDQSIPVEEHAEITPVAGVFLLDHEQVLVEGVEFDHLAVVHVAPGHESDQGVAVVGFEREKTVGGKIHGLGNGYEIVDS